MILSEGQLAEVVEGMALLNRAERHLQTMEERLRQCRVSVDPDSMKNISYYLDKIYSELAPIPLQHLEAVAQSKSR
jgi:hypothetical protein